MINDPWKVLTISMVSSGILPQQELLKDFSPQRLSEVQQQVVQETNSSRPVEVPSGLDSEEILAFGLSNETSECFDVSETVEESKKILLQSLDESIE